MAGRSLDGIDPVTPPPFRIKAEDRVVTAGSCFAQHLGRHLGLQGHPFFETEPAHPLMNEETAREFGYGIYSARYGNIYTSRQLLQLWRRATGRFEPEGDAWQQNGAWYDPFRPTIQPHGFPTWQEYSQDRQQHFAAVHRAFTEADVLVFTLGLTECWRSRVDGAAYPICPGVAAGEFDPQKHEMVNLSVDEVVADLEAFLTEVREVNPGLRLVLTVSPVPLAATAEHSHVLEATTYSKSVLRVAADKLAGHDGVYYFPSYEIVQAGGPSCFAADRRSVVESAVEHVMVLFQRHVMDAESPTVAPQHDSSLELSQAVVDTLCDESRLDPSTEGENKHE